MKPGSRRRAGQHKEEQVQSRSSRAHSRRSLLAATIVAVSLVACEDPITPPPAEPPPIDSAEAVIDALARSYRTRDLELFKSLLAHDPDANADFMFILSEPTDLGETQWGYDEEVRIHQRMFHPETAAPPLDSQLWLQGLNITLTKQENFAVREDLYSVNHGEDGKLDTDRWRVMDARYSTYVFFDMAGTDYKVEGEANFVVIEDLDKPAGAAGKFLILIWEDISVSAAKAAALAKDETWSSLKRLYR
jgi:hypothetical protein